MKRSTQPTRPAAPLTLNCYGMSDILESGLLSPDRIAEIENAMAKDASPVFDSKGQIAANALIVTLKGVRTLVLGMNDSSTFDYHRRNHFAEFLTQDEIALINDQTFSARAERRDAERFEKAEKVDAADWSGWVFGDESYHASVDDWLDDWADRYEPGDDLPTHVWAAEPEMVVPDLSVDEVLQSDIEARGWEDMDSDHFAGTTELQAALDAFVAANREVVSYRENPKKAILVESLCRSHLNELAAAAEVVK